MREGIIFRKNRSNQLLMYVPSEMESNLIRHIHEKIGHLGVTKCYEQLKMHYWFPDMVNKVGKFIQNCIRCIMYSAPARTNQRNLYNIPKEPIPFHTLHLDHFGPLPSLQSKRKHILVVVDAFTKFVKLFPVVSTSTKEVCASLNKYFEYYSRPSRIITDRGSAFTSLEFSSYLLEQNITHVKVAVASPQANGQVERVNRTLTGILSKLSEPLHHSDWVKQLAHVEFALNNTVSRSIQTTPSRLLFGIDQKGIIVDRLTEFLEDKNVNRVDRNLDVIREHAHSSIKKLQDANLQQFDEHHNPAKTYEIGEYVVIKNTDTTIGKNKKLIPKFKGPYVVHKVLPNDRYVIRDIEDCPITQLPYDGVIEACNIRKWTTFLIE
uniref:RNA-directed DNA polymerase n=1 Tax=Phlebotomus papatasi TaxID=29031 RepID=A0A1B0GQT2_PHLPP